MDRAVTVASIGHARPMEQDTWDAAPVLGVPDVRDAVEFFCESLGFRRPQQL